MHAPGGSEWRLWDLHIHSPASYCFNGITFRHADGDEKIASIKQIIDNINNSDRAVYAINDYWTFDGYIAIKDQSGSEGTPELTKTLLPGIELRIESASSHRLNIHVLFSEETTHQQLTDFKNRLILRTIERPLSEEAFIELGRALPASSAAKHGFNSADRDDPEALFQLGCKVAEITKKSFQEALDTIPKDKRLVMIPYDCYGGMEEIKWEEQPNEDLYFMRMAEIIETRNQSNVKLFAGLKTDRNQSFIDSFMETIGWPKPCVSGSDGHSIEHFSTWRPETVTKKTWIKADPTFEGLRQIIFEPVERVRIQAENPALSFEKPYFHSIRINSSMELYPASNDRESPTFAQNDQLSLNPNMVCIIGGRGAGKSRLMDYLGRAFGGIGQTAESINYVFKDTFVIQYNKDIQSSEMHNAATRTRLPFVYISQSEVKDRVSHGKVGEELRRMLNIDSSILNPELASQTEDMLNKVRQLEKWLAQKDSEDKLINAPERINAELIGFRSLLESITTEANKEKLERFTQNVKHVTDSKEKIRQLELFLLELSSISERLTTQAERIDAQIPAIDFGIQTNVINEIREEAFSRIEQCNSENEIIKTEFSAIYSGDLSTLLSNAETYKAAIEINESRLREIANNTADLNAAKQSLSRIPDLISEDLIRQKTEIDSKWAVVRSGRQDWSEEQRQLMCKILADRQIALEGTLIFKSHVFFELLKKQINLSYFRPSRDANVESKILEKFPIVDVESFLNFMREELHKVESEEYVIGDLTELFYAGVTRSKYIFVEPKISYRGRPLEKLSIGQRGTVYLCLKLATQVFSQPLIYDQPEDDLDNEFIVSELVDIFRGIKKYRQVILITHNANIVVNADTEQVIVANNDGGNLSYRSGSLENPEINQYVRLILEGGDVAFKNRERRYRKHLPSL